MVLTHRGEADQAAAVVAWPTGGGSAELPQSRKLDLLSQVFSNRLIDALRERAGASYSPVVASDWPLDINTGGRFLAMAQLTPESAPAFFEEADKIAADLAANGPTADELARATEPMVQLLSRVMSGHAFWLSQVQGAAFDLNRLAHLPTVMDDYAKATPAEMQALAARYLTPDKAFRVSVLPAPGAASGRR